MLSAVLRIVLLFALLFVPLFLPLPVLPRSPCCCCRHVERTQPTCLAPAGAQVQHYLYLFISEMQQLFERHKAIAGQKDVELHIL